MNEGIFAPFNIPLSRRLETFAILIASSNMLLLFMGPLFLVYLTCYTNYGILALLYMTWMFYDRNTPNVGGRRIKFIQRLGLWKKACDYFPITLVKTVDLDPLKNYLFCYHPHGIISFGCIATFGTEGREVSKVFPGLKMSILTLEANLGVPFLRDYFLTFGACSISKESMTYLLNKPGGGNGVILVPGGAVEALDSHPNENTLRLKNRKGFIKLALRCGSPLVPIFTFGETDVFNQISNPEGSFLRKCQQKCMELIGWAPVLFWGRGVFQYVFGYLPHRRPLNTVVGAPLFVEKKADPTQDDIDTLHAEYLDRLKELYYAHRHKYGNPNTELNIL